MCYDRSSLWLSHSSVWHFPAANALDRDRVSSAPDVPSGTWRGEFHESPSPLVVHFAGLNRVHHPAPQTFFSNKANISEHKRIFSHSAARFSDATSPSTRPRNRGNRGSMPHFPFPGRDGAPP